MTPQAEFMVLAPIVPARETELRGLLASMNEGPGVVNPANALIPFARFGNLHFARILILEDKTVEDIRVYDRTPPQYPLYLAFLGDVDGDPDAFLRDVARIEPEGLRAIFSCCEGFTSETDLVSWMKEHSAPAIANYVNWHGRTVRRVQEEAALRDAIEDYLRNNAAAVPELSPRELHAAVQKFVRAEEAAGRLDLSDEAPTPITWRIRDLLHLVGFPFVALVALPLLIVLAPFYLLWLRRLEKTDPELCDRVDQAHSDNLARSEDRLVSNQFTAMGSLKPGLVRLLTVIGVLTLVNWGARHIFKRGRLARIRTIHFARWVFLDNRKRMVFFSNY